MATAKITVTIPKSQIDEIRALVEARQTPSVSGFVKHAIGLALADAAGWRDMLHDALEQTGGPLTHKEREWADGILTPRGHKKANRKRTAA